jgi:serine/threonine protein kinase
LENFKVGDVVLRTDPKASARFVQEVRAGERLKNPHVATVHDIDTVDGVPFMVMEHLTGDPSTDTNAA